MANKYFNAQGERVNFSTHKQLVAQGEEYSVLKRVEYDGIRLSIVWRGIFDATIPDEHCAIYQIVIHNRVSTPMGSFDKWIAEPGDPKLDRFAHYDRALIRFDSVRGFLDSKRGAGVELGETKARAEEQVDDIEDYGEPEVPKDQPKTKSKNLGMW